MFGPDDNGESFADQCATSILIIGGMVFSHKRIHKATWVSPDLNTENQVDRVCISRKFRRSLKNVRVKRGADIASDHHLLSARLKLKLKRTWTTEIGKCQRLNRPAPRDPPDISAADNNLPIDFNEPSKEEIQKTLKQLKIGKEAGHNNIPPSMSTSSTRKQLSV